MTGIGIGIGIMLLAGMFIVGIIVGLLISIAADLSIGGVDESEIIGMKRED